jgi:hypothetical protein
MKVVGKIGEKSTVMDKSSALGNAKQSTGSFFLNLDRLKLESKQGFLSIRTNNCVFKGKWAYEVELITNRLAQIGWCQLVTTFNSHNGVGDDKTSFAFDGYRISLWHDGQKQYGELWDIGDIIGVAIDLDNRHIEFFKNGKSIGIAVKDISVGENVAYFPGISLSSGEKVRFNFGKSPFTYSYAGYEPMDVPDCMFNGSVEITAEFIDILKSYLLKLLLDQTINQFHKLSLTNKIFSYLVSISFKDIFIYKTLIIPFFYELSMGTDLFNIFFEYLYIYIDDSDKFDFTNLIIENLSNYIEETSLKGASSISEWKNLIKILLAILKIDFIVQHWIDANKYIENLKAIFNSNLIKNIDIYNYLKEKYDVNTDLTTRKVFIQTKQNLQPLLEQENEQYDTIYSESLMQVIELLLLDKRTFKKTTKEIKLSSIIADFVNHGYEFGNPNDFHNLFAMNFNKRDYYPFYKNFLMNLYQILSQSYDRDLETLSPNLWFARMSNENIYYDEVGLGGTISHVTSEYISTIDESFRQKDTEYYSDLNHRIIKLSYVVILPALKDYYNLLDKVISNNLV